MGDMADVLTDSIDELAYCKWCDSYYDPQGICRCDEINYDKVKNK